MSVFSYLLTKMKLTIALSHGDYEDEHDNLMQHLAQHLAPYTSTTMVQVAIITQPKHQGNCLRLTSRE